MRSCFYDAGPRRCVHPVKFDIFEQQACPSAYQLDAQLVVVPHLGRVNKGRKFDQDPVPSLAGRNCRTLGAGLRDVKFKKTQKYL
jgi:hypothetical protein